jgi:hypothetical protein
MEILETATSSEIPTSTPTSEMGTATETQMETLIMVTLTDSSMLMKIRLMGKVMEYSTLTEILSVALATSLLIEMLHDVCLLIIFFFLYYLSIPEDLISIN